jgi:hypothetical protein
MFLRHILEILITCARKVQGAGSVGGLLFNLLC